MNLLVSYNWLKQYVKLKQTPQEFAARLSLSGPSVERIYPQGAALEKVVVGKILSVKPHPNADKLRVVETDLGAMTKDVVCGGSNLSEGQLVAVALPGSWVKWHGEGEPVEIKEAALRGVNSYGMICGADEIGLLDRFPKKEEKEIVDLTHLKLKPGTPLAEALKMDDVIFDVEVTSNRPDAYCMAGMALEASAILDAPLLWKVPKPHLSPKAHLPFAVDVKAKQLCPRYQALVIRDVKVGPSPAWMKERLASAGVRSINNLVDITNYVRLELGQPLHVFDYDKLQDHKIVVREAMAGETLKALDGNAYALKAGQLVIADAAHPVAVAGVMGGEASGVTEHTKNIVIEAAAFDSVSVRRTARALNLHSDSSKLYEKGLSVELPDVGMDRAAQLVIELAGGHVASKRFDVRASKYKPLVFPFRPARAAELIGVEIPAAKMKKILTALKFKVNGSGASWKVEVPFWRDHDIEGERDLVEEVARVYGYGNLPSVMPEGRLPLAEEDKTLALEDKAKRHLKDWGFTELMTYSLVSRRLVETYTEPGKLLRVLNPLNEELEYMRAALMPSILQVIAENQEEIVEGRAFELSNVYLPQGNVLPIEEPRLLVAVWDRNADGSAVSSARGAVEALLDEFGIRGLKVEREANPQKTWHPGRTANFIIGGDRIAQVGEIHPELLARFGIERRVAVADVDFSKLCAYASAAKFYTPIPEFPRVKRDLAFVVERHAEHAAIAEKLAAADPMIAHVELFDVYEGTHLGEGKKSMAYHLEFGAADRTLKAEEVDRVLEALRAKLKKEFGAEVRS